MKRILVIDVGNTFTKYALCEDGAIKAAWRHATADMQTAADPILAQNDAPVVVASVVPAATRILSDQCAGKGRKLHIVSAADQSLIGGSTGELGADLLAAAVAARKIYAPAADLLVVGMGTATTITAIGADGSFKGVQITLGLTPTLETLAARCALLPNVVEGLSDITLGFDTASAIRNGTLLAQVGAVEAWVGRARAQLGTPATVVATGGWSAAVAQHTKVFDHVDPDLVLKGILLLYEEIERRSAQPPAAAATPAPSV